MNGTATETSKNTQKPVSTLNTWLYGAGTFGYSMMQSVTNTFYTFFLTNVVMMDAGITAVVTTLSRFILLFWGPIRGVLITKINSRFGKYGFWLVVIAPIYAILNCCTYINFQASVMIQAFFYGGMYIIANLFSGFTEVAALGALPYMAPDASTRVKITSRRATVSAVAGILYSYITVKLVLAIGGEDNQAMGYLVVLILYSLLYVFGYRLTRRTFRDYDVYPGDPRTMNVQKKEVQKFPVSTYFKAFFMNVPLMLNFFGNLLKTIGNFVMTGALAYYFTEVVGNFGAMAGILSALNLVKLAGSYLTEWIFKIIGKKWTNVLSKALYGGGCLLAYFFGKDLTTVSIFLGLAYFGYGLENSISPSVYADCGDYWEWKSGLDMRGYIFTFFNWVFQVGIIFTGGVVAGALASVGYDAAVTATAEQLNMISAITMLVPGVLGLAATIMFIIYPLSDKKCEQIRQDLAERHAAAAAELSK